MLMVFMCAAGSVCAAVSGGWVAHRVDLASTFCPEVRLLTGACHSCPRSQRHHAFVLLPADT